MWPFSLIKDSSVHWQIINASLLSSNTSFRVPRKWIWIIGSRRWILIPKQDNHGGLKRRMRLSWDFSRLSHEIESQIVEQRMKVIWYPENQISSISWKQTNDMIILTSEKILYFSTRLIYAQNKWKTNLQHFFSKWCNVLC